jgi:hypothetical protein
MLWLYLLIAILGVHEIGKRFSATRRAFRVRDMKRIRRIAISTSRFQFHVGAILVATEPWFPVIGQVGWVACGVVGYTLIPLPCGIAIINRHRWLRGLRNLFLATLGIALIGHGLRIW